MNESLDFSPYLERWALQPDGEPFATHSSRLLPVRHRGAAAMLKISSAEEERFGHVLLNWWDGQGAARVLAYDHQALLMERATGGARCWRWSSAATTTRLRVSSARPSNASMPRARVRCRN